MGNVFDDIRESSEARGVHKSSVAFAEKLIRRGKETYEEIAELTGLPPEEITELAHKETA